MPKTDFTDKELTVQQLKIYFLPNLDAVDKLFGEGNCLFPVAGGALLVQDVVHDHRPADDDHPQQEVDCLQGIVVGVQVYDAIEVEGDLQQELWSRSEETLESVEDDGEVFELWDKYAKNLGQEGGWGKYDF